ncbi:stage III sporulation protein AB [Terrisporobacter sp.]|uniref:stage III sporulation protein AB n=1 Tax=Terrisporobacter sp. TaxID=1965305 RepID=UPI00262D62D3|nr:stage III sporulation protein AB [Terrisporobacter sp.]
MQIKIFFIGILIGSSYLIGDIIYKAFIKRHKELNEVISILEIIRMDLAFGLYTLEEIFYRASLKKDYCLCDFFENMYVDLVKEDGRTLQKILNKNIDMLKVESNLQSKEIEEIRKLFLTLGQSDIEAQQRIIDLTCDNLKKITSDSKEEIFKKGALYKKLITFAGICIGIILI